ncbi:MAG: DUF4432 family protein [Propioniciclava sp.]
MTVPLYESSFTEVERPLLETAHLSVTGFRYPSGVAALRITVGRAEAVVLPFRGQQVWRYLVDGEDLTMRTHFDAPARSTEFAETYGAFLLHCGLTGIGHPEPHDDHAHHGELPNASYDTAYLAWGTTPEGPWVGVGGACRLRSTHSVDVTFEPRLILPSHEPLVDLDLRISNHRTTPFAYSYLCHINWNLIDGARLEQPLDVDSDAFTLDLPDTDGPSADYFTRIAADPRASNTLAADRLIAPEYVAIMKPRADIDGLAHCLMVRPDGRAAAVSYEVAHLPHALRWISHTTDEMAAGFCLPTTAHHRGRSAAEADGLMRHVPAGGDVQMRIRLALLDPSTAAERLASVTATS